MVGPAMARTAPSVCGTERGNWREALALHRALERRMAAENTRLALSAQAAATTQSAAQDFGEIAVMDDSGGVIARRNPFSLAARTLSFVPSDAAASRYRYELGTAPYDTAAESGGIPLQNLGDDDSRSIDLPFDFPYFGRAFRGAFVQSDGNVTFDAPEAATAARSLGRLASGPPRLAPLFSDLDPTQPGCDIRVWSSADRVVITWRNVPEYQQYGIGARQLVQLTLWPDGRITFNLAQVSISEAVVGISPGYLSGHTEIVSFDEPSTQDFDSTVAERFGTTENIDMVRTAQRFYETHEDAYDYLVVFNTAGIPAASGALAYESTVRSMRQGIGDTPVDTGSAYGSPYRLQAVLNMGPLNQYPRDPYTRVGARGAITGDTTMSLIGHETGHLFLALASIRDPGNPNARPMLGTQLAHWSFNFNSEASLLEGNRIQDNGPGILNRFLTIGTVEGYSPLDQYLMGLRGPYEVPSTFLVRNSSVSASAFPQVNVVIRGDRQDITIDDIIAAEGRRVPDDTVSQRLFRFAFILIVPSGSEGTSADAVQQLETYRAEFENYYHRVSSERAFGSITLRRMTRVSLWPAAGAVAGEEVRATVEIARQLDHDLKVNLRMSEFVAGPEAVIIPAGQTSAAVTLAPQAVGVADLYFAPEDGSFEVAHVKLDSKASRQPLRVSQYYREGSLLVLRVSDSNELPYSNIPLRVEGTDSPVRSDTRGLAWLVWDGAAPLTVEIEGVPASRITLR